LAVCSVVILATMALLLQ